MNSENRNNKTLSPPLSSYSSNRPIALSLSCAFSKSINKLINWLMVYRRDTAVVFFMIRLVKKKGEKRNENLKCQLLLLLI